MVQVKTNSACQSSQKHFGNDHHDNDFSQQGIADHSTSKPATRRGLAQKDFIHFFAESFGNKAEQEHRQNNDYRLVKNINDNIGQELRLEQAKSHDIMERDCDRSRDAFAKIKAEQEISKDGAQAAADNGKRKDDHKQS